MASVAASVLSTLAPEAISAAGGLYSRLGTKGKTGILAGLTALGFGANAIITIPIALLVSAIAFAILAIIFTSMLYSKYKEQVRRGLVKFDNPFGRALARGIGLAIVGSIILFVVNLLTGGLASIVFFVSLAVSGILYAMLAAFDASFLHDVAEGPNGEEAYTSAFRKFSLAFWPVFLISMLVSAAIIIAFGAFGVKISQMIADFVAPLASGVGISGNIIGSLGKKE